MTVHHTREFSIDAAAFIARPRETAARWRNLVVALFVVYLLLLAWAVLWKLAPPSIGAAALLSRPVKLVPFVASEDAGASDPIEMFANVALFVPFGLYIGVLAPPWRGWKTASVIAASSLALEITQHLISSGIFDTTDLITNTAGGLLGFAVLILARRCLRARTLPVMGTVLLVGTALILVAAALFVPSPHHRPPHRDVIAPNMTDPSRGHPPWAAPGGVRRQPRQ